MVSILDKPSFGSGQMFGLESCKNAKKIVTYEYDMWVPHVKQFSNLMMGDMDHDLLI